MSDPMPDIAYIKVLDVELSRSLETIDGLAGYAALRGVLRLQGTPIGYIHVPIIDGKCFAQGQSHGAGNCGLKEMAT